MEIIRGILLLWFGSSRIEASVHHKVSLINRLYPVIIYFYPDKSVFLRMPTFTAHEGGKIYSKRMKK